LSVGAEGGPNKGGRGFFLKTKNFFVLFLIHGRRKAGKKKPSGGGTRPGEKKLPRPQGKKHQNGEFQNFVKVEFFSAIPTPKKKKKKKKPKAGFFSPRGGGEREV